MFKEIRKADILLFLFFIISALVLFARDFVTASEGASVEIRVDGEYYGTYPLSADDTILIERDGHTNRIRIESGEVFMAESSCKNQICVNEGHIHTVGQTIICLPNRVVAEIKSQDAGTTDGVDAVAR